MCYAVRRRSDAHDNRRLQPPQDGEWIPRYFSDFRREFDAFKDENARQHVELAGRISGLEVHVAERISSLETHYPQVETRTRRWRRG